MEDLDLLWDEGAAAQAAFEDVPSYFERFMPDAPARLVLMRQDKDGKWHDTDDWPVVAA